MPLSLKFKNNCPSIAPFQSPIQVNSTCIEQNISIQENLNVAVSIKNDCDFQHSNRKHMASGFPEETLQIVLSVSISSNFFFFSFFFFFVVVVVVVVKHFWLN